MLLVIATYSCVSRMCEIDLPRTRLGSDVHVTKAKGMSDNFGTKHKHRHPTYQIPHVFRVLDLSEKRATQCTGLHPTVA